MNKGSQCLKVYFEDPFWVGVIERQADHKLEAVSYTHLVINALFFCDAAKIFQANCRLVSTTAHLFKVKLN